MSIREKWVERVAAWKASGLSAAEFCRDKDFSFSSLRAWSGRLRRETAAKPSTPPIRIARLVRAAPSAVEEVDSPIAIEVGNARAFVRRGVDRDALAVVLELLGRRGGQ